MAATSQTVGTTQEVDINDIDALVAQSSAAAAAETRVEAAPGAVTPAATPVVEEEDTTSIDDFHRATNRVPKAVPVAPAAKPTVDTAKPATAVTPSAVASVIPAVVPAAKPGTEVRVLDDIDEPLRPVFKQMSNDAFNAIKPIVLEGKKAKADVERLNNELAEARKGGLPQNYMEHEMAYVLTPEFSQRSAAVTEAEGILNHYRQELSNVRAGGDTYIPLVRNAQGQVVQGAPTKVDRTTEALLAETHGAAHNNFIQANASLNALAETHRTRVADSKTWLNDFESRSFPAFNNDQAKAVVADTVRKFHPALQANPLAPILAKTLIMIGELGRQIQQPGAATTATPAKPAAGTQPSAAAIAGAGAVKSGPTTSAQAFEEGEEDLMEQFNKRKQGL